MKRLVIFVLLLSLVLISCKTLNNLQTPTQKPTSSSNPGDTSVPPTALPTKIDNISPRLEELGGRPCDENPDFTCVTITVPLDHFNPDNGEAIDVVFAVAPARGQRMGMYVQAFPGGPGGSGISSGSIHLFPRSILQNYDIVFFDQRGIGLSNPLECKTAYAKYFLGNMNFNDTAGQEGLDTPQEQKIAVDTAKSFVNECVTEIGIDPNKLQFFRTDQVAEDIESFRQAIGDEKFMLYGDSYGTSVAQAYARAHADHLSGLILDGTMDTTLSGNETAFSQRDAFNMVLLEVFKACDTDPACAKGMSGSSQAAYDELAQKLANAPIKYAFSLSNGSTAQRLFTFNMLDYTVSSQLYDLHGRFELMRAISAAKSGDMTALATLYYDKANIDPQTNEFVGNPTLSDTMYYIVWCGDSAYYNGTPDEKEARLMQAGQILNGLIPRLDLDVLQLGLTCPYWPSAPTSSDQLPPLIAKGVPTFVLSATLDPATPFNESKSVFEHLDKGYLIYVKGGEHVSYFSRQPCPNQYVDDFLINGTLPDQKEIVCDWGNAVIQ